MSQKQKVVFFDKIWVFLISGLISSFPQKLYVFRRKKSRQNFWILFRTLLKHCRFSWKGKKSCMLISPIKTSKKFCCFDVSSVFLFKFFAILVFPGSKNANSVKILFCRDLSFCDPHIRLMDSSFDCCNSLFSKNTWFNSFFQVTIQKFLLLQEYSTGKFLVLFPAQRVVLHRQSKKVPLVLKSVINRILCFSKPTRLFVSSEVSNENFLIAANHLFALILILFPTSEPR